MRKASTDPRSTCHEMVTHSQAEPLWKTVVFICRHRQGMQMQDQFIQRLTEDWIRTFGEPPIVADAALMAVILLEEHAQRSRIDLAA